MTAPVNILAAQLADDIENITAGGAAPKRAAPVESAAPEPPALEAPPGESAVAQPAPKPVRFGKVVPTRAGQVANPSDVLRIRRVDPQTLKQSMINDFTMGDIVAGGTGDVESFIRTSLSPMYGGGTYNVSKMQNGLELSYGSYTVAGPISGVAPTVIATPAGPPPPPPASMNDLDAIQHRAVERDRAAREEARKAEAQRAQEKAEAEQRLLEALAARDNKPSGSPGIVEFLMLQKMMAPPAPVADPKLDQLVDAFVELRGQVQMIASQPPPMPPMAPPAPSITEIVTGVVAAIAPLATGLLGAWQSNNAAAEARAERIAAAQAANAMTIEKAMSLATMALGIAEKMGLIGNKEVDPLKEALAARIMNEINSEPADPMEGIARMLELIEKIRPKTEAAQSVLAVIDKTIDRLPNILEATARYVDARSHAGGGTATTQTPEIFVKMRDAVFQIDKQHTGDQRDNAIVYAVVTSMRPIAELGIEWAPLVMRIRDAIIAEDVEAFRQAWAELVGKAWPKVDPERKRFFDIVLDVVRRHSRPVSNWLRKEMRKPSREEELGLVPLAQTPRAQVQEQTGHDDLLEGSESGGEDDPEGEDNGEDLLDPPEE